MKTINKFPLIKPVVILLAITALITPAFGQDDWYVPGAKAQQINVGSLDPNTNYLLQVTVDNKYAAVETLKLSKYFQSVKAKRYFEKNKKDYGQLLAEKPELAADHYSVLNPVSNRMAMSTMMVTVNTPTGSYSTWADQWRYDPKLDKSDENSQSISFVWKILRGPSAKEAKPVLKIIKTYRVFKDDYIVDVSLKLENLSDQVIDVSLTQGGPSGLPLEDQRSDSRYVGWAKLDNGGKVNVELKSKSKLDDLEKADTIGYTSDSEPVLWIGVVNKFFGSVLYLKPKVEGRLQAADYRAGFYYNAAPESATSKTAVTGITFPEIKLQPKQSNQIKMQLFAGPKDRQMFTDEKNPYFNTLYTQLNFTDTISFGGCTFCTIPALSFGMMWLLDMFSKLALGNYGIAIFILVILVRLCLHPLTKKGQVMMMGMKKMGPELEKIKKKYAHDKQALNRETMNFYKKQGASPFLGCLPMFIQMPIWVALWTGLNSSINLRHEGLLPFWITDLSAPDALFNLGFSIPIVGIETINLLPILMVVPMLFQMQMNPQMGASSMSPEQEQSQKIMKYMFPLMMPIILYNAPSGVSLYILTSTTAGVIEQIIIRKHIREKEELEQQTQTIIDVPGKAPRSSRPKKDKGPGWHKKPF